MRVFASINVIYMVVLGLACFVLTGDWRTADGLLLGVTFICLALGVSFSSIGVRGDHQLLADVSGAVDGQAVLHTAGPCRRPGIVPRSCSFSAV